MRQAVVIGLGIFGSNIAKTLFENGFDVVAIDKKKEMVQRMANLSTRAIVADATDKSILETIGIQPDDIVIVSFGEDLAASTLLTLHLKELGVKTIIVKAPHEDHKRILEMVGATEVIIPEQEMAKRVAKSLIAPNVLDFLSLSDGYVISEVAPPESFIGKTFSDLHLRSRFQVTVLAIRDALTDQVRMVPSASFIIKDSDVLIVIGREEDVRKLK
ncbi:MAG TPA: potassium transporter TrkA [Deltaproteobacteria bacterium]|nr:potassium transporter TrkA [Deltaproteobacteria bacterium]